MHATLATKRVNKTRDSVLCYHNSSENISHYCFVIDKNIERTESYLWSDAGTF